MKSDRKLRRKNMLRSQGTLQEWIPDYEKSASEKGRKNLSCNVSENDAIGMKTS